METLMDANSILTDQVIYLKRGRTNGLGYEPAFNAYFDFYLDTRYFPKPLLQLEDVTFHLYLRKNLNDTNPRWRIPSIRFIKKKFRIGSPKIDAMMARLSAAHLLKKESGLRTGVRNTNNIYVLSDPIPTLSEFLTVAAEGVFGQSLCTQNENIDPSYVPKTGTLDVPEMSTPEQTLYKQTWEKILDTLKGSMLLETFNTFLANTTLEVDDQTAIIRTPNTFAHGWIENRMKAKLLRELKLELDVIDLRCES